MKNLQKCYTCPYATFHSEPGDAEVEIDCQPPMGECLLDKEQVTA